MSRKTIFHYDDYRKYLRDAYEERKRQDRRFSFRYFSRVAGFKSQSVLKAVMDGKRNIAPESITKFAKAFKMSSEESTFFHHLVLMNQAKTIEDRQHHAEQLLKSRQLQKLEPLAVTQFNYYSRWYIVPVRELIALPGFREDPDWIANRLSPTISAAEAKFALETLLALGLARRDERGRLVQSTANLSTGSQVRSTAVLVWHCEMLKKAAESLERHPGQARDISAVTVGISPDTLPIIREMVQNLRKDILELCSQDPAPQAVYQIGFQIFPLTGIEARDDEPSGDS